MIVLLDIDGVIADFNGELVRIYNCLTNENMTPTQIKSTQSSKWFRDPILVKKIIESPGFIRNLPPIENAIDGIKLLFNQGYDIVFVSNGTNCPTSGHEKRDWLNFYFGKLWKQAPLILTKQKYRVRGDCLLDDNPKNFTGLHSETKALLYDQCYNYDVPGFERILGWDHFIKWVAQNR
jgi:5'(3')-deoxyribonucleotidase